MSAKPRVGTPTGGSRASSSRVTMSILGCSGRRAVDNFIDVTHVFKNTVWHGETAEGHDFAAASRQRGKATGELYPGPQFKEKGRGRKVLED